MEDGLSLLDGKRPKWFLRNQQLPIPKENHNNPEEDSNSSSESDGEETGDQSAVLNAPKSLKVIVNTSQNNNKATLTRAQKKSQATTIENNALPKSKLKKRKTAL